MLQSTVDAKGLRSRGVTCPPGLCVRADRERTAQILINQELSRTEQAGVAAARVIDARAQLVESGADAVLETSADPYAAARSAYFQRRDAEIRDAEGGPALLSPEEEQRLLDDAIEQDSIAPEEPARAEPPITPESPPSSGDETALLDIVPSNVLREDAVSGGN